MIIFPIKVDLGCGVSPRTPLFQGCKGEIFALPNPIETTIFLICQHLTPITALVPRHTAHFKLASFEVDRGESVISTANHADTLIYDAHRNGSSSCRQSFDPLVRLSLENQNLITGQAQKVELRAAYRTIYLTLFRDRLDQTQVEGVPNLDFVTCIRHDKN